MSESGALKATLRFGSPAPGGASVGSLTGTLLGFAQEKPGLVDLGETLAADSLADSGVAVRSQGPAVTAGGRTTVLPRRKSQSAVAEEGERPRFNRVRVLGEGGMGQVELARDNDIRRTVAVKRLHAEVQSEEAVLRFADEVRIVGQLEHPSIVPVYDVGRDETGQVYLVMKHLNGETMETIIERLRKKDKETVAQFSLDRRVHLFLGILDAIRYAHARGVIHRDLKPANIMIGPYGEVTVLDWGIAKPIRRAEAANVEPLERTAADTHDKRQETQFGSLAGTPLYMSPEQAAGRNSELDERSDVYSLCMLFYEWLALEHPLRDKTTVTEVLAAIISGEMDLKKIAGNAIMSGTSAEWVHVILKGLARERENRYQSVAEMEDAVRAVLDGRVNVQCHVTLTKRAAYEALAWVDRHPMVYFMIFNGTILATLLGLGYGAYRLIHG